MNFRSKQLPVGRFLSALSPGTSSSRVRDAPGSSPGRQLRGPLHVGHGVFGVNERVVEEMKG